MPQFKRSSIPPLQTITDEQLQELLARHEVRNVLKSTYPKLIDVLIAWMPEITDLQMAEHTNAIYQGFFGQGITADIRVAQCMLKNGYTSLEIETAIKGHEPGFNWLTYPQMVAFGDCFERLINHYPTYPPDSFQALFEIATNISNEMRVACIDQFGEDAARSIPSVRMEGNAVEWKRLNTAKRLPYKPTLFDNGQKGQASE